MIQKNYICICCPLSCDLTLTEKDGELFVSGNTCKRGSEYAKNEYKDPVRMITTTVKLTGSDKALLPVISDGMIPKKKMQECLQVLYDITITAPVKMGDVVCENILGTGVDILAASTSQRIKR